MKNIILFLILISLIACSTKEIKQERIQLANVISDGVITISRPVPEMTNVNQPSALSFMPIEFDNYWLKVNTQDNTLNLMKGNHAVESISIDSSNIEPGSYKLLLKQADPLWYAPDKYFTDRALEVPAQYSNARYLKGALGKHALFLENEYVIHTSETENADIKGISISDETFEAVYSNLHPDSTIIVQ